MFIAYYDESGDDGYPQYSSPLFALSALYLHYLDWKETFETVRGFRRQLRDDSGFPVKMELHTKKLLLGKRPYRGFGWSDNERVEIVGLFCLLVAQLRIRIVSVVIVKPRIGSRLYPVVDNALTCSIQRIENDLRSRDATGRFTVIADQGRVRKMRATARRIQRIDFIRSRFAGTYRREIRSLVEDPLEKESRESYFIQLADLIA